MLPQRALANSDNRAPHVFARDRLRSYPAGIRDLQQEGHLAPSEEIGAGFTVQAGYVGTRSTRQLGYVDINASQVPFTNRDTQPLFQRWGRTATTTFVQPLGTGTYDSLQASVQRRFSNGVMLNVNYTLGKAINFVDDTTGNGSQRPDGGANPYIQAPAYMRMNRAPTYFDRRHNVSISSVWDLPFGRGRHWLSNNGVLTQIVSGWQVNNVLLMASGHPFNVTGDCDPGWPGNAPTMADVIGTPKKLNNPDAWYDPTAFAQVYDPNNPGSCARRLGTSGFDNLRSPGIFNWDFGVFREFAITEPIRLQFRVESFNFTNTPHFDIPDQLLGDAGSFDPKTGRVVDQGDFMRITAVSDLAREGIDERQFRFGLRFSF